MKVTPELVGKVHVVTVDGDLDAGNVQNFKNAILPMLSSPIKLLIDLSNVPFMDSSGMGAIITCQRAAAAAGGQLKLCCPSEPVRTAFDLIRLGTIVDIGPTRNETIYKFSEPITQKT